MSIRPPPYSPTLTDKLKTRVLRKEGRKEGSAARMAPTTQQSPLAMHTTSSRRIMKSRPKVRIVHIFAPEIIKTDAANFRDLVQRLTGKPPKSVDGGGRKKRIRSEITKINEEELPAVVDDVVDGSERTGRLSTTAEQKPRDDGESKCCDGGAERGSSEEADQIETMWMEDSSCESSSCLRELEEIDGFIQELRDLL